jgi:O-antigen/teichoic acid export membrane protein
MDRGGSRDLEDIVEPDLSEAGPAYEPGTDASGDDEHRSEVLGMARQGGLNSAGAIFNQALRFAITFLLARLLGPAGAGLYYQSFAFLAFLGLVASGGFTLTLTRYVAVHRADDDDGALRGTVRLGLLTPALGATAIGIVLYVFAPWLAQSVFDEPRLSTLLRFVAVALPPTAYTDAALSATQGFKTMKPYALINLFFEPTCRIVLTVALLGAGWGLTGVMIALLVTNITSALLASVALKRLMGRLAAPPRYDVREIFTFSALSWFANLASNGLLWADTIILSIYDSASDVGVYQVATRLTLLATVFVSPVTTSFSPRIADLWRRERHDLLAKTYRLITSWVFRLALPPFVMLFVFPRELLALFGPGFEKGITVTVIMTVAWLLNSLSGPSGYMLTMSGRPMTQMTNNLAGLAMNVALNVWLIPRYGIVGAATAWAVSLMVITWARVVQVWAFSKMLPFSRDLLKGVWAGVAAAIAGVAIREAIGGLASLVVGLAAVGAAYVTVIVILGVDEDDRLVLDSLRRRFRTRGSSG